MKKQFFIFAWVLALCSVFFVPRGFCADCGQVEGLLSGEYAAQAEGKGDVAEARRKIIASIKEAGFKDCWEKSAGPENQFFAGSLANNVAQHVFRVLGDKEKKPGEMKFVKDIEAAFHGVKYTEAFRQFSAGFTEFFLTHPDVSEELRGQILAGIDCTDENCLYRLSKAKRLTPDELKKRMDEFVARLEKLPAKAETPPEAEAAKALPKEATESRGEKAATPAGPPPAPEKKRGAAFFVLAALLALFAVAAMIAAVLGLRHKKTHSGLKGARTASRTGKSIFPAQQGRERTGPASVVVLPPPAETARAAAVPSKIPVPEQALEDKPLWTPEQESDLDQRLDGLYEEIAHLKSAVEAEKGQGAGEAARVLKIVESLVSRTQEDFHASQRSFFKTRTRGFFDKNRGLYEVVVNEVQSRDRELYRQLARELPQLVAGDETLAASFRNASAALDEYHSHVSMLEHIIRAFKEEEKGAVTGGTLDRHHLIGSCLNYMDVIQYSGQIPVIAGFKPEKWVRESFLGTADLVLKERQRLSPGAESAKLEKAAALVIEVLSRAGVEAEPIVLCETRFDSKSHVVRSTVNRPDLPDGVITDVVRNGFSYRDGRSIQQAEVIVNRSRA